MSERGGRQSGAKRERGKETEQGDSPGVTMRIDGSIIFANRVKAR